MTTTEDEVLNILKKVSVKVHNSEESVVKFKDNFNAIKEEVMKVEDKAGLSTENGMVAMLK